MSLWLVDLTMALLFVLIGTSAGWFLRSRGGRVAPRPSPKSAAQDALRDLHDVAESVRACIQEHTECIQAIEAELCETAAHEPAMLSAAVNSIRDANQQVCSEFMQLRENLDSQAATINYTLDHSRTLLLTTLSLDQQKHQYQKVLESLQHLAVEVARDMDGCGRKLRTISATIDRPVTQASDITGAITQILNATDSVCQRIASAEETIDKHASQIQMQAVLGHTDMLTALPNRRALEVELERMAIESQHNRQPFSMLLVDLDDFKKINADYGHHGGDVVLRSIADQLKNSLRGGDAVARYGGEEFAVLLAGTTLAQALPMAERLRQSLEQAQHSYGNRALRVTASVGTAQYIRGENTADTQQRSQAALAAAKQCGGNATYWHDGREIHPVNGVHLKESPRAKRAADIPRAIAAPVAPPTEPAADDADRIVLSRGGSGGRDVVMSGRSLFISNLKRRLDAWYGGGPPVSVVLMRVDQYPELVARFGPQASDFLKQVVGRLLEAASRNMDERSLYDDHTFALLMVGCDDVTARRIAKRLRSQVGQCKLRFNEELWELSAAIGAAQCREGITAIDLLMQAEQALQQATQAGGNMLCMSESA